MSDGEDVEEVSSTFQTPRRDPLGQTPLSAHTRAYASSDLTETSTALTSGQPSLTSSRCNRRDVRRAITPPKGVHYVLSPCGSPTITISDPEGRTTEKGLTSPVQVPTRFHVDPSPEWQPARHYRGSTLMSDNTSVETPLEADDNYDHLTSPASVLMRQHTVQFTSTARVGREETDNSDNGVFHIGSVYNDEVGHSDNSVLQKVNTLTPFEDGLGDRTPGKEVRFGGTSSFDGTFAFFTPTLLHSGTKKTSDTVVSSAEFLTAGKDRTISETKPFSSIDGAASPTKGEERGETRRFAQRAKRHTLTPTLACHPPLPHFSFLPKQESHDKTSQSVSQVSQINEEDNFCRSISPVQDAFEEDVNSCSGDGDTVSFVNSYTRLEQNSQSNFSPKRFMENTFTYNDRAFVELGKRNGTPTSIPMERESEPTTPLNAIVGSGEVTPRTPVDRILLESGRSRTPEQSSPYRRYTPQFLDVDMTPQKSVRRSNAASARQTPMNFTLKVLNMSMEGAQYNRSHNMSAANISVDQGTTASPAPTTLLHGNHIEKDYFPPSRNPFSVYRLYQNAYTMGKPYLTNDRDARLPLRADTTIVMSAQTLLQPRSDPLPELRTDSHTKDRFGFTSLTEDEVTEVSSLQKESPEKESPTHSTEVRKGEELFASIDKKSPLETDYGISLSPSAARTAYSQSCPEHGSNFYVRRFSDFSDGAQSKIVEENCSTIFSRPCTALEVDSRKSNSEVNSAEKNCSPFSAETNLLFSSDGTSPTRAEKSTEKENDATTTRKIRTASSSPNRNSLNYGQFNQPLQFSSFEEEKDDEENILSKPPLCPSPRTKPVESTHHSSTEERGSNHPHSPRNTTEEPYLIVNTALLPPTTNSSLHSDLMTPKNYFSTTRKADVIASKLRPPEEDSESSPLPSKAVGRLPPSSPSSSGSARRRLLANEKDEEEEDDIKDGFPGPSCETLAKDAEEDFIFHLQQLNSSHSRTGTPPSLSGASLPPQARYNNSTTSLARTTHSVTNQSRHFFKVESSDTLLSEDEIGNRFTAHHMFQFLHYIPNPTSEKIGAFFLPLSVDPNGVVWLATKRLDGLPYCCKEILDTNSVQLRLELDILTLSNSIETVDGRLAYHFIARYHGCAKMPFISLYSNQQVDGTAMSFPQKRFVYLLHYEYFPTGTLFEWALDPTNLRSELIDETPGETYHPLGGKEWEAYVVQGLVALWLLHQHEIIHGNPLPFNFYIYRRGHLKLSNFGSARKYASNYPSFAPAFLRPKESGSTQGPSSEECSVYETEVYVFCKSFLFLLFLCLEREKGGEVRLSPITVDEKCMALFDAFLDELSEREVKKSTVGCPPGLVQLLLKPLHRSYTALQLVEEFYHSNYPQSYELLAHSRSTYFDTLLDELTLEEMYDSEIDRLYEEYETLTNNRGHNTPQKDSDPRKEETSKELSPLHSSPEMYPPLKPSLNEISDHCLTKTGVSEGFDLSALFQTTKTNVTDGNLFPPLPSILLNGGVRNGGAKPSDVNFKSAARRDSNGTVGMWKPHSTTNERDTSSYTSHSTGAANASASLRRTELDSLRFSLRDQGKPFILEAAKEYVFSCLNRYRNGRERVELEEKRAAEEIFQREWNIQQVGALMNWNALGSINTPTYEERKAKGLLRFQKARPLTSLE